MDQSNAPGSGIININILIDGEAIARKYPKASPADVTSQTPPIVNLDDADGCVYLFTETANVVSGQGTSKLIVKAAAEGEDTADLIRWRAYSMSFGIYQCLITNVIPPANSAVVDPPQLISLSPYILVPRASDPLHSADWTAITEYHWETSAEDEGKAPCTVQFQLLDLTVANLHDMTQSTYGFFSFTSTVQVVSSA